MCDKLHIIQIPLWQNLNSRARKQLEKNTLPTSTSGKFRVHLEEERLTRKENAQKRQGQEYDKGSLSPNCSPMDLPQDQKFLV